MNLIFFSKKFSHHIFRRKTKYIQLKNKDIKYNNEISIQKNIIFKLIKNERNEDQTHKFLIQSDKKL